MAQALDFTKHNVSDFWFGVNGMFFQDLTERSREVVKSLLEGVLDEEAEEYVQVRRYERSKKRADYRNGYRTRSLATSYGMLEDIKVPRSRSTGFRPKAFERYKRVEGRVRDAVVRMFLRGISTRNVGEVMEALCGCTVSASYVSTVTKRLDEEVKKFFDRPLRNDFTYLFLDGIVVKVKDISRSVKRVVLVAYGVRENGSRELIDFRVAKHEGKGAWRSFLENMKVRGLLGTNLKLIVSDGGAGLWAATQEVYPLIDHQLCWVHKLRNVANKCPRKYLDECLAHARQIYLSPSVKMAMKAFRGWERTWRDRVPRAVRCLAKDIDDLLRFLQCPVEHHRIIRTTNVIERLFREFRRRLKPMGTFPDMGSCKRLILAQFQYYNHRWSRRCYRIKEIALTYRQAA